MRFKLGIFLCAAAWFCHNPSIALAANLRAIYLSQVGVREQTGRNDGREVELFLAHVGLKKGNSWCAAFVSSCLSNAGIANPKSGWAPAYFPMKRVVWRRGNRAGTSGIQSGDVFGIYFQSKRRIAHVGFIDRLDGKRAVTVEGNTNEAGSREGDGVYVKRRLLNQIYTISRWK